MNYTCLVIVQFELNFVGGQKRKGVKNMNKKEFKPFIAGNKVIVDLEAKIDILLDDDVYIVSKNSKPLYFFDNSDNAIAFALLIYFDCIDYNFKSIALNSLCNYFSDVDALLTVIFVRHLLFSEDNKNE